MSDIDTAELRAVLAAATPGPWDSTSERADGGAYIDATAEALRDGGVPWVGHTQRARDAALIAAAVNALPALLDAADERDAAIRQARADAWDEGMRWGQLHWATNYGINGRKADNPYRKAEQENEAQREGAGRRANDNGGIG